MATTKRFSTDVESVAVPKGRPDPTSYLTVAGALLLCVAQVPSVRGDSASCVAKFSSYVVELDQLLSKERNWITPFDDLNKRYFPFRDCETDALLEVVKRSSFIRSIDYNPPTKEYIIHFSSDEVIVGFSYLVSEKNRTSRLPCVSTNSGFTKCLRKFSQ